ncbi:MAG: histidine phosphatase family protein [Actinobacteria bacterium]|nr:MAG: histidine phosphatase family protein [Actinomycetota bacterium]
MGPAGGEQARGRAGQRGPRHRGRGVVDRSSSVIGTDVRPDLGPGARIVAIRHGATRATGRYLNGGGSGAADPPITAEAHGEARLAAAALRRLHQFGDDVQVRCSPALRARQTAAAMGWPGAITDARLAEADLGEWEGIGAGVLAGATAASWWSDASFAPPGGGEPLAAVVRRVAPLLDACGEGATTVLVCHQGTILAILMALLGYGLPAARAIALPPGVAVVLRRWADGGSCLDAVVPPTGILRS